MCRSIHHTFVPIMLEGLKISATGSLALTQYRAFFSSDRYSYKKTCIYNSKIVLQTTTRIGEKESAFDKIIPPPSNPFPRVKTPAAYVRVRCYPPARFSNFLKDFLAGAYYWTSKESKHVLLLLEVRGGTTI